MRKSVSCDALLSLAIKSSTLDPKCIGLIGLVDEDADILTITLTAEGRTQTVQGTYEVEAGLLTFTHDGATEVYQRDDE